MARDTETVAEMLLKPGYTPLVHMQHLVYFVGRVYDMISMAYDVGYAQNGAVFFFMYGVANNSPKSDFMKGHLINTILKFVMAFTLNLIRYLGICDNINY
ncbi:hypothetical protein BT63DRAFT_16721 [Microthyrium microscopicum]|uniref:Uncharacterized protein n=1 Tax=Microthyrium microscopicum TaxID=703497 RepID=A0A6A6UT57_9PEZI|nr:hypothetical protein BT63DRAFT_16721 [Microthyrium microscopicum]